MPKNRDVAPAWRTLSAITRLFLPIFLLTVVVGTAHYQPLVQVETRSAEALFAQQVRGVKNTWVPALAQTLGADSAAPLAALLGSEAQSSPDIALLQWRAGAQLLEARNLQPAQAQYPAWFVTWLQIGPHTAELDVVGSTGRSGKLTLQVNAIFAFNNAWSRVRTLAHTFDNMADGVQALVASLTHAQAAWQSKKERAEVTPCRRLAMASPPPTWPGASSP